MRGGSVDAVVALDLQACRDLAQMVISDLELRAELSHREDMAELADPSLLAAGLPTRGVDILHHMLDGAVALDRQWRFTLDHRAAARFANCQLLMDDLEPGAPSFDELTDIRSAVTHAAWLTQQLLAFGRKQPIQPRHVDLATTVESLTPMLHRLIPSTITINAESATRLPTVFINSAPRFPLV